MVNPKYKALLRVAETGSFTQAANDLGYSQSGISGMISSLEKEMGVQLVVRDYGEPTCQPKARTCCRGFPTFATANGSSQAG